MRKITLKLSRHSVTAIAALFEMLPTLRSTTMPERAQISVLSLLAVKFRKKQVEISSRLDLFADNKKSISFTLEYFEAYNLHLFLVYILATTSESDVALREYNLVQSVSNELHQKLI